MLPAEHQSTWVIEQPMRFVRLYFSPDALATVAERCGFASASHF